MNDDDFDRTLRESLQGLAGESRHADLADGALLQAGRIKRRRRVAMGVGAAAVLVLAVPLGAQVIDQAKDHTASRPTKDDGSPSRPVDVAIAGLSQGEAPSVPYIDGRTFRGRDHAFELPQTAGTVIDAIEVSQKALFWTLDPTDGTLDIQETGTGATSQGSFADASEDTTSPAANPGRGEAAWAADSGAGNGFRAQQVVVLQTSDGQALGAGADSESVRQVMGVSDGSVVYNARAGKQQVVRELDVVTGRSTIPWRDATYVTAVDTDLQKLAGRTSDMTGQRKGCSKVIDRSAPDDGWETCDWRPVEFSTDGSLLLAIRPETDGLGPRELAVLDADTGDLMRVLTTEGTFGRATFEGDASVTAVLADGSQAAIVRCGIESGDCELATDAATVTPDDPDSLVAPYQLTAN